MPKELVYSSEALYTEALLNFRTNSGTVSLRLRVQARDDIIEIFDDRLLEKLALEGPQAIEILLLDSSEISENSINTETTEKLS